MSAATPTIKSDVGNRWWMSVSAFVSSGRKRRPALTPTRKTMIPAGRGNVAATTSLNSLGCDAAIAASQRRRTPRQRTPSSIQKIA